MTLAKLPPLPGGPSKVAAAPYPAKAAGAETPAGGAKDSVIDQAIAASPASVKAVGVGFGIAALGAAAGWGLYRYAVKPLDYVPSSKYVPFAGLFVLALAVERLLEPLSGFILPSTARVKAQRDHHVEKAHSGAAGALARAAASQQQVDRLRASRAVVLWGLAAAISMVASGCLGFFLLRSLTEQKPSPASAAAATSPGGASVKTGFPSPPRDPNRILDLVITGLAVGAGTKPLHDLVSSLQASKDAKADPSETAKKST